MTDTQKPQRLNGPLIDSWWVILAVVAVLALIGFIVDWYMT
jgi:preprotein translocase subunit SecE